MSNAVAKIATEDGVLSLLRDGHGVYGAQITALPRPGLSPTNGDEGGLMLSLRPDAVSIKNDFGYRAILQYMPANLRIKCYTEVQMAREVLTSQLIRKGCNWRSVVCSKDPKERRKQQQIYFGLKKASRRITNSILSDVFAVADQKALALARRYPFRYRWGIYKHSIHSRRKQFAETFPYLAARVFNGDPPWRERRESPFEVDAAIGLIDEGAPLKDIAKFCEVPYSMRRILPGAVAEVPKFTEASISFLTAYMPQTVMGQIRWLSALNSLARIFCNDVPDVPFIRWVARSALAFGKKQRIKGALADIYDFVRASNAAFMQKNFTLPSKTELPRYLQEYVVAEVKYSSGSEFVGKIFNEHMSAETVLRLSDQWHEDVALGNQDPNLDLPPPWRSAKQVGKFTFEPLMTANEIIKEGRAMHNCAATRLTDVVKGNANIFRVIDNDGSRVAMVEVGPSCNKVFLRESRGICNESTSREAESAIRRWIKQDEWELPEQPQEKDLDELSVFDVF
jgi:hypothetical protein